MTPEKITTIEQRSLLRGYQKFEIRPDGDMEVVFRRFSAHNQFKFPLWQLNPNTPRLKLRQPGSIVGAVIFGICSLGVIVGMIVSRDWGIVGALAFPLFLFGMLFSACFWKSQTQSVNANVYYFRHGNGQIHVWFEKPDAKTFYAFCEALTQKAEEAWNNRPIEPAAQSLAGEIAALKKLKDSGVLNESEFARAKAKLLGQAEQRKIGFN